MFILDKAKTFFYEKYTDPSFRHCLVAGYKIRFFV